MRLLLLILLLLAPSLSAQPASQSTTLALGAPSPNPTDGAAKLVVSTPQLETVTVEAFDLLGRKVATLFSDAVSTRRLVTFDGAQLPDGLYVIVARSETMQTQRLVTLAR